MFGHMTELFALFVVGLLVFGPKRVIELGGQLGRLLRETQAALKEMNWSLLGDDSNTPVGGSQSPLGKLSQFAQSLSARGSDDAAPADRAHVVEMTPPASGDTPAE